MSAERSGAVPSEPSATVTPASMSSGAGQRPYTDAIAEGLCAMRVPVLAQSAISARVRSVACESSASGPSSPSLPASATLPRWCPSCVKTTPASRDRARVAFA